MDEANKSFVNTLAKEVWNITVGAILARIERRRSITSLTDELCQVLVEFENVDTLQYPSWDLRARNLVARGILEEIDPPKSYSGDMDFIYRATYRLLPFYRQYLKKIRWFQTHIAVTNNSSNFHK